MFWFKRKKIVVDCFTPSKSVYDNAPVKEAANFFPSWWKTVPKEYEVVSNHGLKIPSSTIRRCTGVMDLYKSGIVLPFWSDLIIGKDEQSYQFQFSNYGLGSDFIQDILTHDNKQLSKEFENYHHVKIVPPWAFKEKTGVKFLFCNTFWHNADKWEHFTVVPGIIDFKLAKHPNVNCFMSKNYKTLFFKHNSPLTQLIPFTEKEIVVKRHIVSQNEYYDIINESGYMVSFTHKYRNILKNHEMNKKKCPFS